MSKLFSLSPRPLIAVLIATLLVCTIATIVETASACNTENKDNRPGNPWPWQHNGFGKWIVLHDGGWGLFGGFGDG